MGEGLVGPGVMQGGRHVNRPVTHTITVHFLFQVFLTSSFFAIIQHSFITKSKDAGIETQDTFQLYNVSKI